MIKCCTWSGATSARSSAAWIAIPPGSVASRCDRLPPLCRKYHFEIVHNPSKTDPSRVFANFRNIKRLDAVEAPAPAPQIDVTAPVSAAAGSTPGKLPF